MKNIILALVETFDRHDDDTQKFYYSAAEALSNAREMAREKDPKVKDGYVQAWEIHFADDVEIPKNPENLFCDYRWDGEIIEDLTDEDEGGTNLAEILDDIHPIFCRSFDELAKEVLIDGGKYITAEEAIKRYGFLRLIDDIFAQKCYVYKDYALDIIGEYHKDYDDDEKNDYYDDEHNYAHTIKRLAEPGYHMTQVELIEKLAKSDCFPDGAVL